VRAAAAEAAACDLREDLAARLWASTTARMLWAATICALILGHTLASRALPLVEGADEGSKIRTVAALIELPPQSVAAITAAMRNHAEQDNAASSITRASKLEEVIEETGG
jgi:hypothetical protein